MLDFEKNAATQEKTELSPEFLLCCRRALLFSLEESGLISKDERNRCLALLETRRK